VWHWRSRPKHLWPAKTELLSAEIACDFGP